MEYLIISIVALGASMLTFFAGFGLGTLLMPVFALFFSVETAIATTGVVHLLNNLFKVALIGKHISFKVVLRFGLPAIFGAFAGAYLLSQLVNMPVLFSNNFNGMVIQIQPVNLTIGILLIVFAYKDLVQIGTQSFPIKWLPFGGVLSGFFGGLSGHQGALRSAFLIQLNLSKEVFVASGIAIACMVDLARIPMYFQRVQVLTDVPYTLFIVAVLSAFIGAYFGKQFLTKIKLETLHRIVALAMVVIGLLIIFGVI